MIKADKQAPKYIKWLVLIIISCLLAVVYLLKKPDAIAVTTYTLTTGQIISSVSNTRVGTIKACRRSYLAPATAGQLARLLVTEGDEVKQGQLLMEIWNKDLLAQQRLQQSSISMHQAKAKQGCTLAAGARRDARRLFKLRRQKQIVSEEQVDQASTQAEAQTAACAAANLTIDVHRAELEKVNAAIEQTRVYAPFDGIVAEINAEIGEFVTPSPPGIPTLPPIDLLDVSCLYVSAPIDEVDAPKIHTGMQACVSLDAFDDKRCSGSVTRIAPYVLEKQKQARTVEVEVKLTDDKDLAELLPGYSADIEIMLAEKNHILRIPTEAVLENNHVYWINQDNVIEKRAFTPGLANWRYVEVVSGLAQGDHVVLSTTTAGVKDGAHITAAND